MSNVTKLPMRAEPVPETRRPAHSVPADDLLAAGKRLRDTVGRSSQGVWKRPKDRPDALEILRASDAGRVPELIPIRYGRMLQSPFTFYRGSASVMAADLRPHSDDGHSCPSLRRLPPDELRRLCHTGTQHCLRHQRLRRDPAGAVGVGRQAASGLVRARGQVQWLVRRGGPRRRSGVRAQLPGATKGSRLYEPVRGMVRAHQRRGCRRPARRLGFEEKRPAAD